jgi:hypothetical protein
MPTAHAHVPTERASRYLVQLCRHLGQMSRMRHPLPARHGSQAPPAVQHVDWSDTTGTIRFVQGTCTLQATAEGLALRVEADDEDTLRRLQDGIARRLDTIGRHDHLAVHWQQSAPESRQDSGGPPEDATTATATATSTGGTTRRPRPTRRLLVLAAVATLAILVHLGVLGVLGAALTTSAWAGWGTNITIAVIVVTIVVMGLHGVLGRVAFRRRSSIREK